MKEEYNGFRRYCLNCDRLYKPISKRQKLCVQCFSKTIKKRKSRRYRIGSVSTWAIKNMPLKQRRKMFLSALRSLKNAKD